jgi:hypothetical protein
LRLLGEVVAITTNVVDNAIQETMPLISMHVDTSGIVDVSWIQEYKTLLDHADDLKMMKETIRVLRKAHKKSASFGKPSTNVRPRRWCAQEFNNVADSNVCIAKDVERFVQKAHRARERLAAMKRERDEEFFAELTHI